MKKEGLQVSFAWLFAIIAGVFILFLAIYASVKIIGTEQELQDAKTGKEIGVLLNPLETGFESFKSTSISFPVETRVYNTCDNIGNFGKQLIRISQKSFNKWTETTFNIGFPNKYIFSENPVEGKKAYIFTKPFEFPFKVADLNYMIPSSKTYCFLDAPKDIRDEIKDIGQDNLLVEDCENANVKICFEYGSDCDVTVNYDGKYVDKGRGRVYFEGDALMYAGIFSDKEVYDCQLKRLMQRTEQLLLLYKEKAFLIALEGCDSNVNLDLLQLGVQSLEDSYELASVNLIMENIENENNVGECKLW